MLIWCEAQRWGDEGVRWSGWVANKLVHFPLELLLPRSLTAAQPTNPSCPSLSTTVH